jgi:hypothetical protein
VSKSSFLLLLLTVASLAAAASLKAGGLRMGSPEWRYEAHADIASLLDDYRSVCDQIARAPEEIRYVTRDLLDDARIVSADVKVEAEHARDYVSSLFRHTKDEMTSDETPQNQR